MLGHLLHDAYVAPFQLHQQHIDHIPCCNCGSAADSALRCGWVVSMLAPCLATKTSLMCSQALCHCDHLLNLPSPVSPAMLALAGPSMPQQSGSQSGPALRGAQPECVRQRPRFLSRTRRGGCSAWELRQSSQRRVSGLDQGAGRAQQGDLAVGGVAVLLVHSPQGCASRPAIAQVFIAKPSWAAHMQGQSCSDMPLTCCKADRLLFIRHTAECMEEVAVLQAQIMSAAQHRQSTSERL